MGVMTHFSPWAATTDEDARAEARVEENAEILSGVPVIHGTRIPVHDVAAQMATGASISDILSRHPSLTEAQLRLVQGGGALSPPPAPRGPLMALRRSTPPRSVGEPISMEALRRLRDARRSRPAS